MKLTRKLCTIILPLCIIILPLCITTAFILPKLSSLRQLSLYEFSSNRVLVNSVFNAVILAIMAKNYRPSTNGSPPFLFGSELEWQDENGDSESIDGGSAKSRDDKNKRERTDDADDNDDVQDESDSDCNNYGSDGYDEDDDDTGSYGDVGWDDDDKEEEFDDLWSRSEAFIAKVINGWREEKKSENYQDRNWTF